MTDRPLYSSSAEELIAAFKETAEYYKKHQPESDESINMQDAVAAIDYSAVAKADRVLSNDPSAFAWIFKNYICIKNRKGYKYPSIKFFSL